MKRRILLGLGMVALSLAMIAISTQRTFPIYDEDLPADDFAFYEDVSEETLSRDGTFGGVRVSDLTGRLISTYDRNAPPGRVACPT